MKDKKNQKKHGKNKLWRRNAEYNRKGERELKKEERRDRKKKGKKSQEERKGEGR